MIQKLKNKTALITGASRGIGAAIAKRYANEGAHIIIVARTISGLEEVDDYAKQVGAQCTIVPLDLKDHVKIDELGYVLGKRFGHIDVIVGNAAMFGTLSPLGHIKPAVWDEVMSVNVTANWRLIRSMDPLLRAAPHGRAIFLTSGITKCNSAYFGPYAASKAALEMVAKTYAREMETSNVRINLVDPGVVATKMRAEFMPGEDASQLPHPEDITDIFVALACDNCKSNGEIVRCY